MKRALLLLALCALCASSVSAEDPREGVDWSAYATEGMVLTRNVGSEDYDEVEQQGLEATARVFFPSKLWLAGRVNLDGAPGSFVYNDPRTFTRASLDVLVGYELTLVNSVGCGVFAGGGPAAGLSSNRGEQLRNPYWIGGGFYCRDYVSRMFVYAGPEYDRVYGDGVTFGVSFRVPTFSKAASLMGDIRYGAAQDVLPNGEALPTGIAFDRIVQYRIRLGVGWSDSK